ncbi:ATP-binding protein [Actinotalea solisilvae]|uniref:ATP-binding protein n=1 Tax=Actinotalea solisilvae TaxID=2072922 RepID=UPI0018F18B73|nr:ATP-binding protein [Actinotalea solisilvae]
MRFVADPGQIAATRRWATSVARAAGASTHALRITALLVTEAVANAVIHGPEDGDVVVDVETRDGVVRVSVADASDALPVLRDVPPTASGGRGIMLIDRLAGDWGVERHPRGGKTVWFEVRL